MDSNGIAKRGLICRLLILPGLANDAIANLQWLAENIGTDLHLSVMSQYLPVHRAAAIPSLNRKITGKEYDAVVKWVDKLGFEMGWVQPFDTDDAEDLLGCNMPAGAGVVGNAGLKNQTED
jgi:putative pyruvate formate lyase activating enzyme